MGRKLLQLLHIGQKILNCNKFIKCAMEHAVMSHPQSPHAAPVGRGAAAHSIKCALNWAIFCRQMCNKLQMFVNRWLRAWPAQGRSCSRTRGRRVALRWGGSCSAVNFVTHQRAGAGAGAAEMGLGLPVKLVRCTPVKFYKCCADCFSPRLRWQKIDALVLDLR